MITPSYQDSVFSAEECSISSVHPYFRTALQLLPCSTILEEHRVVTGTSKYFIQLTKYTYLNVHHFQHKSVQR